MRKIYIYKYVNLKTKIIDKIEFTDYQKAFELNAFQWRSTIDREMIYKFLLLNSVVVRNVDRGELVKDKYFDVMEEMNKIWVVYGGKTYESFD